MTEHAPPAHNAASVQWQPIDTAPINGDDDYADVLVVADGAVGEAVYHGKKEGWYWYNNHPTDAWGGRIYPTHWMPLPEPPDEVRRKAEA